MKKSNSMKNKEKSHFCDLKARFRSLLNAGLGIAMGVFLVTGQSVGAGLSLGGTPDDFVEEVVEDNVEDAVEDSVVDSVEDQIIDAVEDRLSLGGPPDAIEEAIEESVEEAVEESVAEVIEGTIEESVEVTVVENIEEDIEQSLEENIEDNIEDSIEQTVEDSVADAVEESVEDSVAASVEESVSEGVESSVEESVEEEVADAVEASVEEEVADAVEASVEAVVALNVEQGIAGSVERSVESQVADAVEERLESTIDLILESVESEFEIDEGRIRKDQWLVMAEPEVFEKLALEGYLFDKVTELPGIGMRLAEVAAPSSFDITEVRQGVMDVLGSDHAEVDLNHIYTAGAPLSNATADGVSPRKAISFPTDTDDLALRIGMIDSQVDASHPSLAKSRIESRSFAPAGAELPDFHGTAIASIIAGNSDEYRGLAPSSVVFSAGVFEKDKERGEIASTVSLVMALDWLISSGVDVINISLAGPSNRLLKAALSRASEKDVMILAAAGNGGPAAQPMYPAAYDSVVAVTAVDTEGQIFRLANRGQYLDLAAPGVSMLHAKAGGGYAASSGTSFAVPFAATAAARIRQLMPGEDALEIMHRNAQDLGTPGWDEVYGYGLLRPDVLITSGAQTASR
ncbi:MAG: S8 family serine peptidase [Halioglobus sp.]